MLEGSWKCAHNTCSLTEVFIVQAKQRRLSRKQEPYLKFDQNHHSIYFYQNAQQTKCDWLQYDASKESMK